MQTQPHPVSADAGTRPKPKARPYPSEPSENADHVTFWLHSWMRDAAKSDALWTFAMSPRATKAFPADSIVRDAFFSALTALQQEAGNSLKELKSLGGLLFAWDGTTKLEARA